MVNVIIKEKKKNEEVKSRNDDLFLVGWKFFHLNIDSTIGCTYMEFLVINKINLYINIISN